MNTIIIIIIIICIVALFGIFKKDNKKISSSNYIEEKEKAQEFDGNIEEGKKFIKAAKEGYVDYGVSYDVSQVYRYNIQDEELKEDEYLVTLNLIRDSVINGEYDNSEVSHILDKMISDENVELDTYIQIQEIYMLLNERRVHDVKRDTKVKKDLKIKKKPKLYSGNIVKNDNHNVHDHNLQAEMIEQFEGMKKSPSSDDIELVIRERGTPKAMQFIKTIDHTFTPLGMNEREIYQVVWNRICDPVNTNNVKELKRAFFEAVEDSVYESNGMLINHCSSGRVARAIGSLAMIDASYGVLKTNDMLKKEIFDKSAHIMDSTIEEFKNDPIYGDAAKGMRDISIKTTPEKEQEFNNIIKSKLSKIFDEYSFVEKPMLDNIKLSVLSEFD